MDFSELTEAFQTTRSGIRINLLAPKLGDIEMIDIAAGLRQSRSMGHTTGGIYTVAQHSVVAAKIAPGELKLAALLHDAHEAYLGDLVSPLKRIIASKTTIYAELTAQFDRLIGEKFNLDPALFSCPEVAEIDARLLATELTYRSNLPKDVFAKLAQPYTDPEITSLVEEIVLPDQAMENFLITFPRTFLIISFPTFLDQKKRLIEIRRHRFFSF